jgi:hypothetical protein
VIVAEIERTLTPGMQTHDIYKKAFAMLRVSTDPVAAKYSLRRAIFGLGPTGFPFEDFLAKLFESEGYTTRRRILIRGKCATHEVDVAAYKKDHSFVTEAKFHMRPGIKSDLQVVLYSYARYLDLQSHPICKEDRCGIDSLLVVTNTKFTHTAIRYAECSGLDLLSWDYPKKNSLQERIETSGLYPITVLTGLSNKQKVLLIERGVILCNELLRKPNLLRIIGVSSVKSSGILTEVSSLCGSK